MIDDKISIFLFFFIMWIIKEFNDRIEVYYNDGLIESYPTSEYMSLWNDDMEINYICPIDDYNNRVFSCPYEFCASITMLH